MSEQPQRAIESLQFYADTFARLPTLGVDDLAKTATNIIAGVLSYRVVLVAIDDADSSGVVLRGHKGIAETDSGDTTSLEKLIDWLRSDTTGPKSYIVDELASDLGQIAERWDLGEGLLVVPVHIMWEYQERQVGLLVAGRPPEGRAGDAQAALMILDILAGLIAGGIASLFTRERLIKVELQEAAAMSAARARSQFLANMSHEIRTPMNAIMGFSQLLERAEGLTTDQRANVDAIMHSAEHLLGVITDILEMSKIDAGRATLNEQDFDLYALLDGVEDMFRVRTDTKQLQFSVERRPGIPRFGHADDGKLRQILINLLSNAFKFTHKGGVVLRVQRPDAEARTLEFEVEDTGVGIASEDVKHVFNAFEQTRSGVATYGGTGLGLAICREYAQLMGGGVSLTSQVGVGSVFRVQIPVGEPTAGADTAAVVDDRMVIGLQVGQPDFRVVVVDDRDQNRIVLSKMLRAVGFDVREGVNGEEAISLFNDWAPHVILMDLAMPVLNGYEATRRIKSTSKGQATYVIALSASSFDDNEQNALDAGADEFIPKPFREQELFAKIGRGVGVEYIYREPAEHEKRRSMEALMAPESISAIPPEVVQEMKDAVGVGDFDRLHVAIDVVSETDSVVGQGLRDLVNRFQYDALLMLLESKEAV